MTCGRFLLTSVALGLLTALVIAPVDGQTPATAPAPNLIVDISSALIEAAVRRQVDRVDAIAEIIQGNPVGGQSRTIGSVHAELVFDADQAALDVVARGTAYGDGVANADLVYVTTKSTTAFEVRRRVCIDAKGIRASAGAAGALSRSALVEITNRRGETDTLITTLAQREFARTQQAADEEVADKAARRASARLAEELAPQLARASATIGRGLTALKQAGIRLESLQLTSTPSVLVASLRLATPGGTPETPPPSPPADADVGVRLHQSLINATGRSALGGKTFRIDELSKSVGELTDKFLRDDRTDAERAREREEFNKLIAGVTDPAARITFGADDPIIVTFGDGSFTAEADVVSLRIKGAVLPGARIRATYRVEKGPRGIVFQRQGDVTLRPPGDANAFNPIVAPFIPLIQAAFNEVLKDRFTLAEVRLPAEFTSQRVPLPRVTMQNEWLALAWKFTNLGQATTVGQEENGTTDERR